MQHTTATTYYLHYSEVYVLFQPKVVRNPLTLSYIILNACHTITAKILNDGTSEKFKPESNNLLYKYIILWQLYHTCFRRLTRLDQWNSKKIICQWEQWLLKEIHIFNNGPTELEQVNSVTLISNKQMTSYWNGCTCRKRVI